MDNGELNKQEMFIELNECCTISEDVEKVISYAYDKGFEFANKINSKNNIIKYIFVCVGFIVGSLLSKLF